MAKQRLFSKATNLVGTTLDKTEAVTYEALESTELVFKSITNTLEEFNNDTKADIVDSRLNLATKMAEAQAKLKELGYTDEAIEEMLNFNRRR